MTVTWEKSSEASVRLSMNNFLAVGLVVVASGCGPGDRQAALIGPWAASSTAGIAMAFQMKDHAKSGSDAYKAGRAMAATGIEIVKDGTFVLIFAGQQCKGDWKFDKEKGEVELKVKSAQPLLPVPDGKAAPFEPRTYSAFLDEDNSCLRFVPAPPDAARQMNEKKGPGTWSGIPLEKKK